MPVKIAIMGVPEQIERMEKYYRITMREGGSPVPLSGMPAASEVELSVFVSFVQAAQVRLDRLEKGKALLINGEITLDMPVSECPGELGVIATSVNVVDAPVAQAKQQTPVTKVNEKSANYQSAKPAQKAAQDKLAGRAKTASTATDKGEKGKRAEPAKKAQDGDKSAKKQQTGVVKKQGKQSNKTQQVKEKKINWKKIVSGEITRIHKEKNGVCEQCGQHVGRKIARALPIDDQKMLDVGNIKMVCVDCFADRSSLTFFYVYVV